MKCVMCGEEVPEERKKKDTCSDLCALKKMAAWTEHLHHEKDSIMRMAITLYKQRHKETV